MLALTPGMTGSLLDGSEYIPGEHKFLTGDVVQGANVLKDDGVLLLDAFLQDPIEFGDIDAFLLGDLNLNLDLSLT